MEGEEIGTGVYTSQYFTERGLDHDTANLLEKPFGEEIGLDGTKMHGISIWSIACEIALQEHFIIPTEITKLHREGKNGSAAQALYAWILQQPLSFSL